MQDRSWREIGLDEFLASTVFVGAIPVKLSDLDVAILSRTYQGLASRFSSFRGWKADLLSNFTTTVAISICGMLTGVLVARLLGPDGRGELAAAVIWPSLINGIVGFGQGQSVTYFSGKLREDAGRVMGTALVIGLFQGLLGYLIGWLLIPIVLSAQNSSVIDMSRWYLLIVLVGIGISYSTFVLQGSARFLAWNISRIIGSVCYLAVIATYWLLDIHEPMEVIWAMIATSLLPPVVGVVWLLRSEAVRFRSDLVRPLLDYGGRSWLASIPAMMNARLDQLIMSLFIAPTALGYYAIAVVWAGITLPVSSAIANTAFAHVVGASTDRDSHPIAVRAFRYGLFANLIAAGALGISTPLLLPVLFGSQFMPSVVPAIVLVVASVPSGMNYILSDSLRGLNRPLEPAIAEGVGLLMTGLGLAILLPILGIVGAAIASLLSYFTTFVVLVIFLKQASFTNWRVLFDLRPILRGIRGWSISLLHLMTW